VRRGRRSIPCPWNRNQRFIGRIRGEITPQAPTGVPTERFTIMGKMPDAANPKILSVFFGAGYGGDASVYLDLWEALGSQGCDVTLASLAGYREILDKRATGRGAEIRHLEGLRELSDGARRHDLVHLHFNGNYVHPKLALQFARACGSIPAVATLHGPEPLESFFSASTALRAKIASYAFRAFIVPSRHKFRQWRERGTFGSRIHRIPNPIRTLDPQDRDTSIRQFGLAPGIPCIVYLGLMRKPKAPDDVLRAAALLKARGRDVQVLLAGVGHNEFEAELAGLARELGVRCEMPGFVERPEEAYGAADVTVYPSKFDNFPIALFEAATVLRPLVASQIPVVIDELSDTPGVVTFAPGEPESLADALERALDGVTEGDVQRCRQSIEERFGFARIAKEHLKLYQEVGMGGCRGRSGNRRGSA
jgi:glycosyltransferase involved in cell wall biosynthesis